MRLWNGCVEHVAVIIAVIIVCTTMIACEEQTPDSQKDNKSDSAVSTESSSQALIQTQNQQSAQQLIQQCQSCHGENGNKSKDGSPFIAGLSIDYMLSSITAFQQNARDDKDKHKMFDSISKPDQESIAAHYSNSSANWNAGKYRKITKPAKQYTRSDVSAGKSLSKACTGCHGEKGNSVQPLIPSLAGLQADYLKSALLNYFSGQRTDSVMKHFSRAINKEDSHKLAAYFSTLKRNRISATTTGNSNKGKQITEKYCAGCHGADGNSFSKNIPSLTGQHPDYLVNVMQAYKNNKRKNRTMEQAMKSINKTAMTDIAAFYNSQTPKKFQPAASMDANLFDPVGKGKILARTCSGCHGKMGNKSLPGNPRLTGLDPDYIKKAIKDYTNGKRKHSLMKSFVKDLSADDIERLSIFFATQEPLTKSSKPKQASDELKLLISKCNGCHGEHGNSKTPSTPTIAGQDTKYLKNVLSQYSKNERLNKDMSSALAKLTSTDFDSLANYYSQQTAIKPDISLPQSPKQLAQKCNRCHGKNGFSTDLNTPRIAGQIEEYIFSSLQNYKSEKSQHTTMFAMAEVMSSLEMKAIASHYASQTSQDQ